MSDQYDFVYACKDGDLERVRAYLDAGGDIDEESFLGETGLSRGAGAGHLEVVAFLIDRGADLDHCESSDSISSSGRSPIAAAAEEGYLAVVDLLLMRGASPETPTHYRSMAPRSPSARPRRRGTATTAASPGAGRGASMSERDC